MDTLSWILSAILFVVYIFCLFTVCRLTFAKGRIILGIVGIFLPFLWLIGAILPAKAGSPAAQAEASAAAGYQAAAEAAGARAYAAQAAAAQAAAVPPVAVPPVAVPTAPVAPTPTMPTGADVRSAVTGE